MTEYPTTIKEIQAGLAQGSFTAVELVQSIYQGLQVSEPKLQALLASNQEQALEAAKQADQIGYGPDAPKLNGVPMVVKDNILTKGLTTTAASKILANFNPSYDATVVTKLKEAGAIIIAKANLDEFAMGASCERSAFQVTHNPWNLNCVPGGSSGGSSATVSGRQVPASLGTDTGGSIRQPAAFTGIVGMKPTYGSVSRYGVIAFGSSLDQVGPMTLTVEDNAKVLEVIAGHDDHDSTSLKDFDLNYSSKLGQSLAGLKIAFPREYKDEAIHPDIRQAMEQAAEFYRSQGAIVDEVSLPHSKYGINVYYIIASSEASSNLQRFDGVRYGYRSQAAKTLEDVYVMSRSEGFGDEVKRRIMLGTFSLSSGYYDAYFNKAAQVRTLIKQEFNQVLAEYDLIMGPTTTSTAFEIGGKVNDPVEMYVADLLTVNANLTGLPALSIPAGFDHNGLPIGLQLLGRPLDEATIYQAAHAFETNHDFASQVPQY
ncbi:Asp-tRNA(Asn)/Glu-tRNA(Gln) amidotransferase subunit GatA [Vaginisenegalia massiliensis]|uniref:Asp-tRNA(Asn)/Glu-tRNA(Gln) amidotransferase subunit GatA n=1 Tax=Vaginisenegalia massiliensis TaxID=2058294 RepID=UPI000F53967A|nr:Asp-tRNA(Asn)/Glu-tRNA(Gln) amidotransferase subunit GatA [Vaginisenegalia massiliensis]